MIRFIRNTDLPGVVEIYNQAVLKKFETADTEPVNVESRTEWLNAHHNSNYPVRVYEINNQVAGWLSISPYRPGRGALRNCVEISYYIHHDHFRKGIGSALIKDALQVCKTLGYKSVFAIIIDRNIPSINLLKKHGFEQWAHMPGIAEYGEELCGHVYYGIKISASAVD